MAGLPRYRCIMASQPDEPSAPGQHATAQGHNSGDKLDAVLEQLRALRHDLDALRDEVRAMGRRCAPKRERSNRDPGDAVPPGVAVQDPAPLSPDDRKARRNLERLPPD